MTKYLLNTNIRIFFLRGKNQSENKFLTMVLKIG